MKYYMFVFMFFTTGIVHGFAHVSNGKDPDFQGGAFTNIFVGNFSAEMSLPDVLAQANTASEVTFCSETWGARLQLKKDWSALGNKSVEEVILELKKEGFDCIKNDKAILVVNPNVKKIEGNFLNGQLQGFKFKGNHQDFLYALAMQSQQLPPITITSNGHSPPFTYDIDITDQITVRDLLMRIASNYGIAWRAKILMKESPLFEIMGSDGEKSQAKGSNIILMFNASHSVNIKIKGTGLSVR